MCGLGAIRRFAEMDDDKWHAIHDLQNIVIIVIAVIVALVVIGGACLCLLRTRRRKTHVRISSLD